MKTNDSVMDIILKQIKQPLWENWYIKEKIGGGSFGAVYRVEAKRHNRTDISALKIIPVMAETQDFFGDDERKINNTKKLLENESAIMYSLKKCPNIVTYEEEDSKPFYVDNKAEGYYFLIRMEYLSCVWNMIKEKRFDFSESNIIKLAYDIANGLKSAHDAGIIHRDIKPSNLFMSDDGTYKLGDFGISKHTMSARSFAGTSGYTAPEIYHSVKGYDRQADIYSLGICLYQMTNDGLFPLERDVCDRETAINMRVNGEVFGKPFNASAEFSEIIMKACEYDTAKRYKTADEMLKDLETLGKRKQTAENFSRDMTTYAMETVFSPPPSYSDYRQQEDSYIPKPTESRKHRLDIPLFVMIFLIIMAIAVFTVKVIVGSNGNDDIDTKEKNSSVSDTEDYSRETPKTSQPDILPPEKITQPDILPVS